MGLSPDAPEDENGIKKAAENSKKGVSLGIFWVGPLFSQS